MESLQRIAEQIRTCAPPAVEVFQYPAGPDAAIVSEWAGWAELAESNLPREPPAAVCESDDRERNADLDRRLDEERRLAFEAGREKGREEGRALEREAEARRAAAAEKQRNGQAAELVENFRRERERYFDEVEREVVELALAIAARVLRREAQMDPLLLTGAVRVALGQLAGTTAVRLKVPAEEVELWTENLALLPNLTVKPAVTAGEGMRLGQCRIETEMGSVDLGLRAQLEEIERGFFDRNGRTGARAVTTHQTPQSAEPEMEVLP